MNIPNIIDLDKSPVKLRNNNTLNIQILRGYGTPYNSLVLLKEIKALKHSINSVCDCTELKVLLIEYEIDLVKIKNKLMVDTNKFFSFLKTLFFYDMV